MRIQNQNFLTKAFRQFPVLAGTFNRYAALTPAERLVIVHAERHTTPRRIWTDLGIAVKHSETLAGHATGMLSLMKTYGARGFDTREAKNLISVWANPRVLAGEIPLSEMSATDRQILRKAAAELIYQGDYFKIGRSLVLNDPTIDDEDESSFVNDLDYIRTAMEAQYYKGTHPHLMGELNAITENCHSALLTGAGKEIWKRALASGMPQISIKGVDRDAANDASGMQLRLVSGSDIAPVVRP
jgi:hypothetical protein